MKENVLIEILKSLPIFYKIHPEDKWSDEYSYKIFVYAENKKIKIVQVDGDDGNGYYGTGYSIAVKFPEKEV